MKAWLLDDFSGIKGLRLSDSPEPVVKEGEAILQVRYAALNPADRYLAEGQYPAKPQLPHILGRDGLAQSSRSAPVLTDLGLVSGGRFCEARSVSRGQARLLNASLCRLRIWLRFRPAGVKRKRPGRPWFI